MKNKASVFLKQIMSTLTSIARAKTVALKNTTSAVKARLVMLSVLKSKKVWMTSISNKIHSMLQGHEHDDEDSQDDVGDQSKAIVLYNAMASESHSPPSRTQLSRDHDQFDDDKYPDLRHSLFDEYEDELDFEDLQGGSIVDLVKNSKEEGDDFRLEDEIDHVADLFIMRFHKQMRLQKLESFKRYKDMLDRSL
ncbi:hypothetical protein L1049_006428 [Liquidambar formosana]|uniref:Uncharacterized protein n=1 Tax=Liquidambar formosana TaxID=63359 RepID=A0AAP0RFI3_LIQFO